MYFEYPLILNPCLMNFHAACALLCLDFKMIFDSWRHRQFLFRKMGLPFNELFKREGICLTTQTTHYYTLTVPVFRFKVGPILISECLWPKLSFQCVCMSQIFSSESTYDTNNHFEVYVWLKYALQSLCMPQILILEYTCQG